MEELLKAIFSVDMKHHRTIKKIAEGCDFDECGILHSWITGTAILWELLACKERDIEDIVDFDENEEYRSLDVCESYVTDSEAWYRIW